MADPEQLAILGGSATLAAKVLGPTADYVGQGLRQYAERRVENINRIIEHAALRLGDRIDQPGTVSPRVAKEVFDEGSYWDDPLGVEYFGGLLASSRTEIGRDDRAASLASLVSRLSTYQLRCHHLFYALARDKLAGRDIELGDQAVLTIEGTFYISRSAWSTGMDLSEGEKSIIDELVMHSVFGLYREDLIGSEVQIATAENIEKRLNRVVPEEGLVFALSLFGIELFTAAHGLGGEPIGAYLDRTNELKMAGAAERQGEALRIVDIPPLAGA